MAIIEVCAANLQSVLAAGAAGAHRIELCSALGSGGITPSAGLIRSAVRLLDIPVCVLIRPREGNFVYDAAEVSCMVEDIAFCADHGVSGVVIGALTDAFELDSAALERMIRASGNMEVVLHRAFDFVKDREQTLEQAVSMGFARILTSGQNSSAWEGREVLRNLIAQSGARITVMPGSGIHAGNIADIHSYTGANDLHLSAKTWIAQNAHAEIPGLESGYFASAAEEIGACVKALANIQ